MVKISTGIQIPHKFSQNCTQMSSSVPKSQTQNKNAKKIKLHMCFVHTYESVFIKHAQCPKRITQLNAFAVLLHQYFVWYK